jgi:hypothetical protein
MYPTYWTGVTFPALSEENREELCAYLPADIVDELEGHVSRFDFEKALEICNEHHTE